MKCWDLWEGKTIGWGGGILRHQGTEWSLEGWVPLEGDREVAFCIGHSKKKQMENIQHIWKRLSKPAGPKGGCVQGI